MGDVVYLQENESYMVCEGDIGYAKIPNALVDDWAQTIGVYGVAVYVFIARRQGGNGYGYPSITDICSHLGISKPTAIAYIDKLEAYGLIHTLRRKGKTTHYMTVSPMPIHTGQTVATSKGGLLVKEVNQLSRFTTPVKQVYHTGKAGLPEVETLRRNTKKKHNICRNRAAGKKRDGFQAQAESVLQHLNSRVGRNFRGTGKIPARLRAGATVAECCLVIDYLAATWSAEFREKYLNHTSPFRSEKFEVNLSNAQAWSAKRTGGDNGLKVVL